MTITSDSTASISPQTNNVEFFITLAMIICIAMLIMVTVRIIRRREFNEQDKRNRKDENSHGHTAQK